jgi:hypothetical protein
MKKTLALLLVAVACLVLCACSGGGRTDNNQQNTVIGTYKNVSAFLENKYNLHENSTYDKTPSGAKGTYKASKDGGFVLTRNKSSEEEVFAKKDQYYYRTNLICAFETDEDYGLPLQLDENGRSNQWFSAYYDSISDSIWNVLILELKDDGTFRLRDCIRTMNGSQSDEKDHTGTYRAEGDVLFLNYDGADHPFLMLKDKVYFDVLEKVS